MKTEMISISKKEYEELKKVDKDLLETLKSSLKDIKEGKVRRVK